jgi:hypothetical protein
MDPQQKAIIEQQAVDALRNVYDPEIPVNVYDLGLIYDIVINDRWTNTDRYDTNQSQLSGSRQHAFGSKNAVLALKGLIKWLWKWYSSQNGIKK